MSVVLKELERRNDLLLEFSEMSEEKKALEARLAVLDQKLGDFDKDTILAEIDELTEDAIKLGYLEAPVIESELQEETQNIAEEGN